MSNEELVTQIREHAGDNSRYYEELYEQNRRWLYKIARRFTGYDMIDDLMQECYIALVKAVEMYQPEQGNKFISYLSKVVHGHLCTYTYENGSVYIGRNNRMLVIRYKKLVDWYRMEKGTEPLDTLAAYSLGISTKDLDRIKGILKYATKTKSLDEPLENADGDITLSDTVAADGDFTEDSNRSADQERLKEQVERAIAFLNTEEQRAI